MGNKRAPYIIGTLVASVVVVLAFAAIVPAINQTPTTSTALNTLGHLTLIATHPDGTVDYRQTDNFVMTTQINEVFELLFLDGTDQTSHVGKLFKWLSLCGGVAAPVGATVQTDTSCSGGSAGAEMSTPRLDGTVSAGSATSLMTAAGSNAKKTLTGTITILLTDDNETFSELALFDQFTKGAGNLFSVATFAEFLAQTGTQVQTTYVLTITG